VEPEAMSAFVMVKRELLEDLLDSARLEADQRVASYGEDYRPHVLVTLRKMITDAEAVLAQEAGKVEPVAWLVTDIHGQKKALRAGAEGIERHRNAGSILVPLFASPTQPVSVDDGWHTDDCGNLRYRPEEEQPAPVSADAAKAFARGFNTLERSDGKYRINMQFANREEAWAAFTALSRLTAELAKQVTA
jgi:hypothetical protein